MKTAFTGTRSFHPIPPETGRVALRTRRLLLLNLFLLWKGLKRPFTEQESPRWDA